MESVQLQCGLGCRLRAASDMRCALPVLTFFVIDFSSAAPALVPRYTVLPICVPLAFFAVELLPSPLSVWMLLMAATDSKRAELTRFDMF